MFAGEGLSIPLVTAPGDFNQPDIEYAERFYAACSDANVDFVKLGYWHWTPRKSYWEHLDEVRGHLEGFEKLSRETGVKTVVHNHSGTSMALHSCAAMNVVKGFDSACIGVFADPGHLSLCGEPIDMALDIVRDYLSVVAFKDLLRQRPGGNPRDGDTKVSVMRMGQGFVNWPIVIKTLKSIDFDGPISFHSEYSGEPPESVVDLCRLDVRFIKSLWN